MIQQKEVSKEKWKVIVWTPIILGAILWSIGTAIPEFISIEESLAKGIFLSFLTAGGILVGWGFGLAYSKAYKVRGIGQ